MELGFNCFEERKIECKWNLLIFYSSSLLRMTGFMKIFSPIRLSFMGANTRPNTKYIRQLICFIFLSNYLKVCWTLSLLSMWLSHPPGQYQFICLINPCNEFKICLYLRFICLFNQPHRSLVFVEDLGNTFGYIFYQGSSCWNQRKNLQKQYIMFLSVLILLSKLSLLPTATLLLNVNHFNLITLLIWWIYYAIKIVIFQRIKKKINKSI